MEREFLHSIVSMLIYNGVTAVVVTQNNLEYFLILESLKTSFNEDKKEKIQKDVPVEHSTYYCSEAC